MNTPEKRTRPQSTHPASRAQRKGPVVRQSEKLVPKLPHERDESAIVSKPTTQSPVFVENQNFNSKPRR